MASPGFSGAPVFLADMQSQIGTPMGMISSKDDASQILRETQRVVFVVPRYRIGEQLARVLAAERGPSSRPPELKLAASLIPAARASLQNIARLNNTLQFRHGVTTILKNFEAVVSSDLDDDDIKRLASQIGNLEHQLRTATEEGFDGQLRLLSLQDLCGALSGFGKKLRECYPDAATRNEVPNAWAVQDDNNPLAHAKELTALKAEIAERLAALTDGRLIADESTRKRARYALEELEETLDLDPLPLRVIDDVRRKLEELDRSLFRELIIVGQLLLGRYAALLPDCAVFRDFRKGPEMVVIPSGSFMMGSPNDENGRTEAERPQHQVTIPNRFALGRYPVTVKVYLSAAEQGECPPPEWWDVALQADQRS